MSMSMLRNDKISKEFIDKLKAIIEADMHDEYFGVSELASKMNISRSSLYTKVKVYTGDSVSRFICKERLHKAKTLLFSPDSTLTISEVAFEVGFNSTSYFIKCFHDYYGYPPGDIKTMVIEDRDEGNSVDATEFSNQSTSVNQLISDFYKRRLFLFSIIVMVIIGLSVVFTRYVISDSTSSSKEIDSQEISIAILPFKNLSLEQENQYFADGVMEDILTSLSRIEGYKVISRTSTEQYRYTDKMLSDIGNELNVKYVLEGSVQNENNNVKVQIQLTDASENSVMWSGAFNNELKDIFELQNSISIQIVKELKTVLSPEELELIEKKYTENIDAYIYYMKGRFFAGKRTKENFEKSIYYYKQALKVDSTYSLAYAGLANVYNFMVYWELYPNKNEGIRLMRKYAYKAISIDKQLAEVHATIASIKREYDHDYDEALNEIKLAISINPNYPGAYTTLAELLLVKGELTEGLKYLDKAMEFDPNNVSIYARKSSLLYMLGRYEESITEGKKGLELEANYPFLLERNFKSYVWAKQDSNAIDVLVKIVNQVQPNYEIYDQLMRIYVANGISGIVYWYVDWLNAIGNAQRIKMLIKPVYIADLYAAIQEWEKALDYLEVHIEETPYPVEIIYSAQYREMYSHPRFKALVKRMNKDK